MRIFQVFLFTTGIILSGCQKQNVPVLPAENNTQVLIESSNIAKSVDADNITSDSQQQKPQVIVYYFHRTMRCPTCLAIETNAAKVIEADFKQQLSDGSLTWLPSNLDDPGGEKLKKQFDISVSTLVM